MRFKVLRRFSLKIHNPEPGDVRCADCPGGQLAGAPLGVAEVPRREPAPA